MNKEKECRWYSCCPIRRFTEQNRISQEWSLKYCLHGGKNCERKRLEESGVFHPDNMMPDGTIDGSL